MRLPSTLIAGAAEAFLTAGFAILDAGHNLIQWGALSKVDSIQRNAEDLILHSLRGDYAFADLDAVTLAIQAARPWDPEGSTSLKTMDYVLNRSTRPRAR